MRYFAFWGTAAEGTFKAGDDAPSAHRRPISRHIGGVAASPQPAGRSSTATVSIRLEDRALLCLAPDSSAHPPFGGTTTQRTIPASRSWPAY